jgi:mannitol operon repressor
MRDEDLKDFSAFLKEFQSESDRGAALVGAALIDHKLADTLRAFMVRGKVADELIDGGTAPLGTFSARTKATFALGLINRHEMNECTLIRKVRNEFAHRKHGTTFKDPVISAFCHRLKSGLPGDRTDFVGKPRAIFVNAVVLTVLRLTYRDAWVARERRSSRFADATVLQQMGAAVNPPR